MLNLLTSLKLRGPRLLVRPVAGVSMNASGTIILASTQTEEVHSRGVVERVGPGELNLATGHARPLEFALGDLVYYAKFAGTTMKFGDEMRLVLMEDEIQATVSVDDLPALISHREEEPSGTADHFEGEPCAYCLQASRQVERDQARVVDAVDAAEAASVIASARAQLRGL